MNNRVRSHLDEIDMIGQLADMKEQHYKNTLALSTLIDLLIKKGFITRNEFTQEIVQQDNEIS